MPDGFGLAAIVVKFALYLGLLTASGTVLATLMFRLENTRSMTLLFAVIGAVATVLAFMLQGANLTGDIGGMVDPEMLALLWSTQIGSTLAFRLVGVGFLIGGLFTGRIGTWIAALGALSVIWSFMLVGHVAAVGSMILNLSLFLHLATAALWIGILTPLARLSSHPATFSKAADVGHRFGVLASVTVPVLIVVGGYMAYQIVGSVGALLGTQYGQALIVKVAIVGGLLLLAAVNKLRLVPALRAGDVAAARHLKKTITIEWAMIALVIGVTAILTTYLTLPT